MASGAPLSSQREQAVGLWPPRSHRKGQYQGARGTNGPAGAGWTRWERVRSQDWLPHAGAGHRLFNPEAPEVGRVPGPLEWRRLLRST